MNNEIKDFFDRIAGRWDDHSSGKTDELREMLKLLPLKEGMKVLDIGCGTGIMSPLIYEITKTTVDAIDISDNMIELARKKYPDNTMINFEVKDFYTLNVENKYDFTIIFNSYPHFLDPIMFEEKLSNILKQNGYFCIMHSLSREKLKQHHQNVMNISRNLPPINIEKDIYEKDFNIIKIIDADIIIFIGQKK